jgi:hypothetical protein
LFLRPLKESMAPVRELPLPCGYSFKMLAVRRMGR